MRRKPDGTRRFVVYRYCVNWEAGDVAFDSNLLWFETLAAARAVYDASLEEAIRTVTSEFRIIRRNPDTLVFSSGYSWCVMLLGFGRLAGETLVQLKARVRRNLYRDPARTDAMVRAALVAFDGGHLDPHMSETDPDVRPIDLDEEIDRFIDAGYP